MPIEIRVPALGESLVEATVGRWRKQEGDPVQRGDLLVDLETEKINLEVEAEESGVLERIARREGETVQVGDVLAVLDESAARPATSPSARAAAAEKGIDLSQVAGSGRGGRVSGEDVRAFLEEGVGRRVPGAGQEEARRVSPSDAVNEAGPPAVVAREPVGRPATTDDGPPTADRRPSTADLPPLPEVRPSTEHRAPGTAREERVRLSRRRLTIARRLVEAQHTAAILTTFNEIDMTAVMELRRRRRDSFQQRHGVGLGFMSFFTRAVVGALKEFPTVNSELQGEELVLKRYYDIGIAVSTDQGLVVPVLREADRKTFAEIEREIADLARRARENQLTPQDLLGGTFTITNGGVFGSLLSTPILNPPQVGILGMHTIQQRPIALEGQVVIRSMMYVALSYDHRVIDGREAVQFLVRVKQLVEDPESLLLEA